MQLQDFQRFAPPDLITHSMLVSSAAILTAYIAFVSPASASAAVLAVRDRARALAAARRVPRPA